MNGEAFLLVLLRGDLHTRAMMNPWSLVAALAVVSLSSCGLSSEKKAVIARASSIQEFPVPRATLMSTLGLENQPGTRHDVRIRGQRVSSTETWQHPAGLTITAYDMMLSRRQIDEVILGRDPDEVGLSADPLMTAPSPPSESFGRFEVKDEKKVLFRSGEAGRESQG